MKRILVVTGGGRGIGAGVARHAASRGWSVAVLYRSDTAAADELVGAIERQGGSALAVRADVADEAAIVAAFARIDAFGPLGALVNSAGINVGRMRIADYDAERLARLLAVNVTGTMLCSREAVRRMSRRHGGAGGTIVNVSSMAATIGGRGEVIPYAASKGAVDVFTIGAAKELAEDGIAVLAIRPGAAATDMTQDLAADPARRAAVERTIAMKRLATVDDIARPIVALLEPEMAYLSGAVIDASGGGLVF